MVCGCISQCTITFTPLKCKLYHFLGNGILEVENIILLVASAISLVTVLTVCGWCRRLFQKPRGNNNDSFRDDIVDTIKHETSSSRLSSRFSSPTHSSDDDSLSRITSPGHGRRTIRFPSPPEVGVDVLAIQPEKNSASDVIIPPEPALPDPSRKEYLGQIFFSLKYDSQSMTLGLKIMKAMKLPAKDFSGTSDPFVKICLLPDKKHKMETRVKRKNLNPVWNEYFMFEGFPYNKLMQRTLCLQVLDYDRFSRNDPIGDVRLSLENLNLGPEPIVLCKELQPSSKAVSTINILSIDPMLRRMRSENKSVLLNGILEYVCVIVERTGYTNYPCMHAWAIYTHL